MLEILKSSVMCLHDLLVYSKIIVKSDAPVLTSMGAVFGSAAMVMAMGEFFLVLFIGSVIICYMVIYYYGSHFSVHNTQ